MSTAGEGIAPIDAISSVQSFNSGGLDPVSEAFQEAPRTLVDELAVHVEYIADLGDTGFWLIAAHQYIEERMWLAQMLVGAERPSPRR